MVNVSQAEWERRRQPRCLLRRDAELLLSDGVVVKGRTDDAGTGGVFFICEKGGRLLQSGEDATLRLKSPFMEAEEIPCRVAHVKENGVGLQVDTSDGRFGLIVSSDLYMDLQKSTGINIPDRIHVRVSLVMEDGRTISGRVKSLTNERLIFHNALNDPDMLRVGSMAEIAVSCLQVRPVEGKGQILSHRLLVEVGMGGRERKLDYCTVEFHALSGEQAARLDAMLGHIQNEQIWGTMRKHATRSAGQSSSATPKEGKSAQEIYKDFNQFFGFAPASRGG